MQHLQVKRIHPDAKLPEQKHPSDAGFDISTVETYTLKPGERRAFPAGIAAEFPHGYVALFRDRSSMAAKGIHALGGVIDANYRGEWKVVLVNLGSEPFTVNAGDRIVQCLFRKIEQFDVVEVQALTDSDRGHGGFGSTGA
jgi:dUTP pyrophosphatase